MFYLGIDWGTQSSKVFTFDDTTQIGKLGPMPDSTLYYDPKRELIGFSDAFRIGKIAALERRGLRKSFALKRQMITNPNAPFWKGEWDDTNLTLGASVTFSLLGLLHEAIREVGEENRNKIIDICFSFPNWSPEIDLNHNLALRKFRQAVRLAVLIGLDKGLDSFVPQDGVSNTAFLKIIDDLNPNWEPPVVNFNDVTKLCDREGNGVSRSYLPESIAGGFPYLLHLQSQEDHAFRVLVVDVGAGSTDIGYLAQWRIKKGEPFYTVYHKPAPAIGVAGEAVTEAVAKQFSLLRENAESRKIELSNLKRLHTDVPYVKDEWIKKIADSAHDYVQQLPYHILMDRPEPVRIIITGGSGAVPGLMDEVLSGVEAGLRKNPNKPKNSTPKSLTAVPISARLYPTIDIFETGRRVVSIGAGQPSKAKLVFA